MRQEHAFSRRILAAGVGPTFGSTWEFIIIIFGTRQ
jgi:hypothetical protein